MLALTIHLIFLTYTVFLAVRVIGSWFPRFSYHPFMRFLRHYTDPYLNLFRRVIPPIGGAIDLSPMLGFIALQILEKLLLSLFH